MEGDCSELRGALGRIDIHVLTAGVPLQAALMPLILYGGSASRADSPAILPVTYAFEAVCFMMMIFMRSRGRNRVLRLWMSSTLARAMNEAMGGHGW
jgi:hypothetical protein